jgi:hypothetical protein
MRNKGILEHRNRGNGLGQNFSKNFRMNIGMQGGAKKFTKLKLNDIIIYMEGY